MLHRAKLYSIIFHDNFLDAHISVVYMYCICILKEKGKQSFNILIVNLRMYTFFVFDLARRIS